jgi:phosphohistidine phosphatase SixA
MKRVPQLLAALALLLARPAFTQTLSGEALIKALRQGGYVLVMRHASSPRDVPAKESANPDNVKMERQLDDTGRVTATAMGQALRDLEIPIGTVLTSPTYRALQTVRFAQLPAPRTQAELGDGGQSMAGGTEAQSSWLKQAVVNRPRGTNTILVTHLPNMTAAFPQETTGLADGETLVFAPDGKGGATVAARIKIEEWSTLAR